MAITFDQNGSNSADEPAGTDLTVTLASNVDAGDLVVAWCKWEGASGAILTVTGAGGGTWANGTLIDHANGDLHGQFAYNLSATGGAATVTMTLSAGRVFRRCHVWVYSYTGTMSFDAQATGQGASTTPTSDDITTTGTDEVVLGGYGEYGSDALSSQTINDIAADRTLQAPANSTGSWDRILTATFGPEDAAAVKAGTIAWLCNIIAFKAAPGAGGGAVDVWRVRPSVAWS